MSEAIQSEGKAAPSPVSGRGWIGKLALLSVVVLVVGSVYVWKFRVPKPVGASDGATASAESPRLIDFQLTDTAGRQVSRADLQGRWLVVNFVFSSCSLSCLRVNYRMAELQRLVADQPDVRLLSLSIDPVTDTPEVLEKFSRRFHPDTNRWIFLTGEKRQLYALIGQTFLGNPDPKLAGMVPGGWSKVDHIALVDPQGKVRGLYEGTPANVSARIFAALMSLKGQPQP